MTPVAPVKVATPAPEKSKTPKASTPLKEEPPKTALDLAEKFNSHRPTKPANGIRSTKNPGKEVDNKKKEEIAKDFAATITQNPKANVFVASGFEVYSCYCNTQCERS